MAADAALSSFMNDHKGKAPDSLEPLYSKLPRTLFTLSHSADGEFAEGLPARARSLEREPSPERKDDIAVSLLEELNDLPSNDSNANSSDSCDSPSSSPGLDYDLNPVLSQLSWQLAGGL